MSRSRPLPDVAVAYIRVSTSEQEIGPAAQRHAIKKWCRVNKVTLACDPFVDQGVSGGLDFHRRPALVEAVGALKEHNAAILVAHKRDRLARDREVIGNLGLMLRKAGRRICTTESPLSEADEVDPMSKAMEGVQDIFAELERSVIRARTKAAMKVKRDRGERVGPTPYGYRLAADGKHLALDPKEQKLIRLVHRLRSEGLTLQAIASELTERGLTPKRGGIWRTSSIGRILERQPHESKT